MCTLLVEQSLKSKKYRLIDCERSREIRTDNELFFHKPLKQRKRKMNKNYFINQKTDVLYELAQNKIGSDVIDRILDHTNDNPWNTAVISEANTYYSQTDSLLLSRLSQTERNSLRTLAWVCKEYDTYVWLDPTKRAESLQQIIEHDTLDEESLLPLICKSWCLSEHTLKSRNTYMQIFKQFKDCEYFQQTKKKLENSMTVYRAGSKGGISWTLSNMEAKWFQAKHRGANNLYCPIINRTVYKKEIVCFINFIGEQEVIILPPEKE